METSSLNKAIVLDFWKRAIGQRDLSVAEKLVADNYIQHSAAGKGGKAGLMESLALLKKMPKQENQSKPLMQVIADGDYVVVHMLVEFGGQKMVVLDLVRLERGLLAEHWDAVQPIPDTGYDDYILDATTKISDEDLTGVNKKLITDFYRSVHSTKNVNSIKEFAENTIVLHNPAFENGIEGLKEWIRSYEVDNTHRVIGEGNFVVIQTSGRINGVSHVIYDLYRVSQGLLAEKWSVKQRIPEKMAHENGVI